MLIVESGGFGTRSEIIGIKDAGAGSFNLRGDETDTFHTTVIGRENKFRTTGKCLVVDPGIVSRRITGGSNDIREGLIIRFYIEYVILFASIGTYIDCDRRQTGKVDFG